MRSPGPADLGSGGDFSPLVHRRLRPRRHARRHHPPHRRVLPVRVPDDPRPRGGPDRDPLVDRPAAHQRLPRPLAGAADELYETYLRWNADNTERLIRGYDGVREVLAALRAAGVHVGVATSKRRESAQQAMDILGLS